MKRTLAFLVLLLLALPAIVGAQAHSWQRKIPKTLAAFPSCGTLNEGDLVIVTDASSRVDCDATPEANAANWTPAICVCHLGVRLAIDSPADLSGYVVAAGTSAGTAIVGDSDDADGGVLTLKSAAGADTLLQLSRTDSVGGQLLRFRSANNTADRSFAASFSDLNLFLGDPGASNLLSWLADGNATWTGLNGLALTMNAAATPGAGIFSISNGGVPILYVDETGLVMQSPLHVRGEAALPTCDAGMVRTLMADTSNSNELCYCGGSSWAAVDGSGTCD